LHSRHDSKRPKKTTYDATVTFVKFTAAALRRKKRMPVAIISMPAGGRRREGARRRPRQHRRVTVGWTGAWAVGSRTVAEVRHP
jgi:hypothetical protein